MQNNKYKYNYNYKISYIKNPFAYNGFFSFGCILISIILGTISLRTSVLSQGEAGMLVGALGLSSGIFSIASIFYAVAAFGELEKNVIFAKISIVLGSLITLFWICTTIVGFFV